MCLAVPMEVVEIKDGDELTSPIALVELGGIRREIRLDIVDRLPHIGDYVIVHAGFAVHSLTKDEAEESISLIRRMADGWRE
ncbi:MAG: HypC/HybG/HupF family hydrogenase formation chaperone [Dissulfurimicrobium sp.]|uniref:HypC/HybG/HupF family hydrogenase formation chaperone n=1 Tax=Dissulfurimicrobium TaxID=1769732 RepID=UPI001EDAFEF1|nr:HypC/HybG/HupF family hydrogenase formation chaperone [Dissulfurimicrobium hydrothermale]UKL13587.1 HypC/HybG/HupF family hydrogenase formation chaperone [Dissulfurimicrobium hydrothermale]